MKYFPYKKAVSPLIATVVLLVVVVGVGAVIAGIARNYVTESKQQTEESISLTSCSTLLDMDFVILNQDVQVCKGVGSVQFMIENKAGEVDDFQVKLYSATGVVSNDSVVPAGNALGRGATALFTANYSGMAPADIIEMHVVPKLKSPQGSSMFCTDVKLVAKNIDNC